MSDEENKTGEIEDAEELETASEEQDNQETTEKEEKKGGRFGRLLENSPISGIFGGRPWILLILAGFIAVLLFLMLLVGIFGQQPADDTSTVTPGVLTAAIVAGEDRFAYHDAGGALAGIEPSMAQSLADMEGLSLKVLETETIEEALSLVDTNAADVAFGRISSERNLTGYQVSDDYGRCGLFLLTSLHDYTDSLELMTGYSIGVMDSVQATAQGIDNFGFISPRAYQDAMTMGEEIRSRTVNMGICTERDAVALVKAFPEDLQTQEISGGPDERYVAVFSGREAAQMLLFNAMLTSGEF